MIVNIEENCSVLGNKLIKIILFINMLEHVNNIIGEI